MPNTDLTLPRTVLPRLTLAWCHTGGKQIQDGDDGLLPLCVNM
jgi:hypothetical protein